MQGWAPAFESLKPMISKYLSSECCYSEIGHRDRRVWKLMGHIVHSGIQQTRNSDLIWSQTRWKVRWGLTLLVALWPPCTHIQRGSGEEGEGEGKDSWVRKQKDWVIFRKEEKGLEEGVYRTWLGSKLWGLNVPWNYKGWKNIVYILTSRMSLHKPALLNL